MCEQRQGFITRLEYEQKFLRDKNKRKEALEQALDIRKFEIGLYWERAKYFWGFSAAIFAGYFLYLTKVQSHSDNIQFAIACIGLMFTYSWLLVNKGSKFWQNNWERHVDLLENEFQGPLYKTVLLRSEVFQKTTFFSRFTREYPFSVSKINQLLSAYLSGVWVVLGGVPFIKEQFPAFYGRIHHLDMMYGALAVVIIFLIHVACHSGSGWAKGKTVRQKARKGKDRLLIYVRKEGSP